MWLEARLRKPLGGDGLRCNPCLDCHSCLDWTLIPRIHPSSQTPLSVFRLLVIELICHFLRDSWSTFDYSVSSRFIAKTEDTSKWFGCRVWIDTGYSIGRGRYDEPCRGTVTPPRPTFHSCSQPFTFSTSLPKATPAFQSRIQQSGQILLLRFQSRSSS